jgi:2-methylcitrate dehydratase PrpD
VSIALKARSLTGHLASWASELAPADVPARIRELVKSQLLSQLACARAGLGHPLGDKAVRALGSPLQPDPKGAACALAALTGWLSFDDSAYGGHLSHSTVNVPLAYASSWGVDGAQLLMAITVANECAARVTAAATLGGFRGQGASYTHLAGAVAARMRAEDAPVERWLDAFGLAFGMPPRTLYRGLLGSDAKVLAAATPVRAGLDACDAAYAGLAGAADILEHPHGFLDAFAAVPLARSITAGLGERWHTDTLSFKILGASPRDRRRGARRHKGGGRALRGLHEGHRTRGRRVSRRPPIPCQRVDVLPVLCHRDGAARRCPDAGRLRAPERRGP